MHCELGDLVVRRRHPPNQIVIGQPWQVDVGAQDADALDDHVVGSVIGVQAEHDDLVAVADHGSSEAVDVCGDAPDHERWILPGQHQNAHGRRP